VIEFVDEHDEVYLEAVEEALTRIHSELVQSPSEDNAALLELLATGHAYEAIPDQPGEPDADARRILERAAALAELVLGEDSPSGIGRHPGGR
jgi:hypothetical protein